MYELDSRPDERIERLEERVEELREAIRRSRILAAAGRACALAGAAWLAGLMFGFVTFMPVRFLSGVVVGLGGLILMGSSVGSTRQLELSLRQAENERTRRLTPWNWSPSKMANDFSARSRRTRRRTATGNTSWESAERHGKRSRDQDGKGAARPDMVVQHDREAGGRQNHLGTGVAEASVGKT